MNTELPPLPESSGLADVLGNLPEPSYGVARRDGEANDYGPWFSALQMHSERERCYALGVATERERCAQVADEHAKRSFPWGSENADIYHAQADWASAIAKSIRQMMA